MQLQTFCMLLFFLKSTSASDDKTTDETLENPMYDAIFTTVFQEHPILLRAFVNSVVATKDKIRRIDRIDSVYEDGYHLPGTESSEGSTVKLNILAVGMKGKYFKFEVQRNTKKCYDPKTFNYWITKCMNRLPRAKRKPKAPKYPYFNKTFEIHVLNFTTEDLKSSPTYLYKTPLNESESSNAGEFFVIDVPKFISKYENANATLQGLNNAFEAWLFYFQYADIFKYQHIPRKLKKFKCVEEAIQVYNKLTLTREEWFQRQKILKNEEEEKCDGKWTKKKVEKISQRGKRAKQKMKKMQEMDEEMTDLGQMVDKIEKTVTESG